VRYEHRLRTAGRVVTPLVRPLLVGPGDAAPPPPFVFPSENLIFALDPTQNITAAGGAVSAWGPANPGSDLSTLTGTATLVPAGPGGAAYVSFDGASDRLGPVGPDWGTMTEQTLYLTARVRSLADGVDQLIIDGESRFAGAIIAYSSGAGGYDAPSIWPIFGGNVDFTVPLTVGAWFVLCLRMRGDATSDVGVNLGAPVAGDAGGGGMRGLTLGAAADGVEHCACDIGPLGLYGGVHGDATRLAIMTGLMAARGIS